MNECKQAKQLLRNEEEKVYDLKQQLQRLQEKHDAMEQTVRKIRVNESNQQIATLQQQYQAGSITITVYAQQMAAAGSELQRFV